MRTIALALIALCASGARVAAQHAPSRSELANQQAAQRRILALYDAVSQRDEERYRDQCTTDFLRVSRDQLANLDRSVAALRAGVPVRDSRIDFLSTRATDATATLIYQITSGTDENGHVGQRRSIESATLVKRGREWKVAMIHSAIVSTTSPPAPPPASPRPATPPWAASLPVTPGDSVKDVVDDGRDRQVVTFFKLDQIRDVDGTVFVSGSGYVEIKGGGTYFAGMNRSQDPFLELTVMQPDSAEFLRCRTLLAGDTLLQNAIAIGGDGYFMSMKGARERQLGVIRLDTVSTCEVKPRR